MLNLIHSKDLIKSKIIDFHMAKKKILISACGLTCYTCPILRAPFDKAAGEQILKWYKSEGWYEDDQAIEDIINKGDYCKGCRSNREDVHWSPDCSILKCCIDQKNLNYCFECEDFPCEELEKWSEQGEHHQKAIENLKLMKKGEQPHNIEF